MLAGVDINGGLSWNGWTSRGRSVEPALYASGGTTRSEQYEVFTAAFAFEGDAISDEPVQAVAPAPLGFQAGRSVSTPFGSLKVSAGAFAPGNTILGIGVRATDTGSITGFKPTIRFDLDNDSYKTAAQAGTSVGLASFSQFSEQGDFSVQFEGANGWRGSTISVQAGNRTAAGGSNDTVSLPGGVGSGTSYDFAFRAFAQPAANAYQMFFDMTAIPQLYGNTVPAPAAKSIYGTFFPNKVGVGPIGDRVTVSLNGLGTNNVVFDANLTLPPVDLDVDSDNSGSVARSAVEDGIEDDPARPGLILPVGGERAPMLVDVPAGRTATLAITQGAENVRVWTAPTGGTAIPTAGMTVSNALQTFWIEAFAPSARPADIAFTLTPTGASPASSDTVRATAVATDVVAHRTGDFYGQPLSELHEDRRNPNEFIVLTNNDFDAAALVPDDDAADDEALDLMGVAPNIDDDLMRVTLKRLPLGLPAGLFTCQIVLSDPQAVRLFREDGSLLYVHRDADDPAYDVRLNSPAALWGVVGAPGAFEFLATRNVDIWVEALTPVPSFSFDIVVSLATNTRVIGVDGFTSRFAEIDMRAQSLLLAGAVDTDSSDIPDTARFRFATTNLSPAATTVTMSNAAGPRQATLKPGPSASGFFDIYYGRSPQASSDGALQFDPDVDDLIPTTVATSYDSHSRLLSGSSRGFLYYAFFHKAYGLQELLNEAALLTADSDRRAQDDAAAAVHSTELRQTGATAFAADSYDEDDTWATETVDPQRVFPGSTADDGHGHALLSYYRAYAGGYGQFVLNTFLDQRTPVDDAVARPYHHEILVANTRQGWWRTLPFLGSDVIVTKDAPPLESDGPTRIRITINSEVSPPEAAELLAKTMEELSKQFPLLKGLEKELLDRLEIDAYRSLFTSAYKVAAEKAGDYAEMFYRSVAFVSTGADLVITMNDLAHGDLSAIIGGIPIVGRAAASTLGRFRIRVGSWVSNVADTAVCRVFRQGCFDGETPVLTESGSRLIRDIGPGTRVWAYDTAENRWFLDEVVAAHAIPWMGTMVRLDLGTGSVLATDQHPVWVVTGADLGARPAVADLPADEQGLTEDGRWVAAIHVRAGDTLLLADGSTAVVAAVSTDYREQTVYTLTVANAHTFAVGDMGLLVHNGPACTEAQFNAIRDSWQHFMKCEYLRRTDGTVEILYKTGATNKSLINAVRAFNNGGQLTFDVPGRGPTTITFTGGFADFRPFMYGHPQSRHTLKTMGIDSTWDIDEAWKASGLDRKTLEKDWVWHHTEKLGELILVDRAVHTQVKHTGGAAIFHTMLQRWADLAQLRPDLFSLSDAPLP